MMKRQTGFTLMEVMLALGLTMVTLGAIYTLYLSQSGTQAVQEDILDMQQTARSVVDLVSRELRMAGYDPTGVNRDQALSNDFFGITFDPSQLVIHADLNGNGQPTDKGERIVYSLDRSTNTIRRNTGGGRQPLGENIDGLNIGYFDRNGQATTLSKEIRQIEISITARTAHQDPRYPKNNGYRTFTLQSRVTPKNLGLGD